MKSIATLIKELSTYPPDWLCSAGDAQPGISHPVAGITVHNAYGDREVGYILCSPQVRRDWEPYTLPPGPLHPIEFPFPPKPKFLTWQEAVNAAQESLKMGAASVVKIKDHDLQQLYYQAGQTLKALQESI